MLASHAAAMAPRDHRRPPPRTTLLMLVQSLSATGARDDELVATARELVRSGRVVLTGNFALRPAAILAD